MYTVLLYILAFISLCLPLQGMEWESTEQVKFEPETQSILVLLPKELLKLIVEFIILDEKQSPIKATSAIKNLGLSHPTLCKKLKVILDEKSFVPFFIETLQKTFENKQFQQQILFGSTYTHMREISQTSHPLLLAALLPTPTALKWIKEYLKIHNTLVDSNKYYSQIILGMGAKNGHKALVKLLLKNSYHLSGDTDTEGIKVLNIAIAYGHKAIVKVLLKYGAHSGYSWTIWRKNGVGGEFVSYTITSYDLALDLGYPEIAELLKKKAQKLS
jgi:hypothetical protein